MKLRIRGNTLRLRLSRSEVDEVAERGEVRDGIAFGAGLAERLGYALVTSDAASVTTARLEGGSVEVIVPRALAREWAASERVGFEAEQSIGGGGAVLKILVEKDFACLTPRTGEDDTDAFPNPNETC
jgi:hypothetical protein